MRAWWWYAVGHAVADVHFKKIEILIFIRVNTINQLDTK
jgi:hypothetical protein